MSGALLPWDDTFLDPHARRQFPQSLRRRPRDPKPRAKHPERRLARTWNGRGPKVISGVASTLRIWLLCRPLLSLLKTRLSQRSCVVRSDRLFGRHGQMAWDPSSDIPLRGSHAPRVGAGESRAKAATRRVESASATAAADGDGPDLLDRVGETLEELAEFLAGGAARDRGAVAPPGVLSRKASVAKFLRFCD